MKADFHTIDTGKLQARLDKLDAKLQGIAVELQKANHHAGYLEGQHDVTLREIRELGAFLEQCRKYAQL